MVFNFLAPVDYEDVFVLLEFTGNISRQCFDVRIIDDDTFETDETFVLTLMSENSNVIVMTANVTIVNDDGKELSISLEKACIH